MEGLIRWWVRNPVAANLLMLIIVTAGWLGLRDIEKEAFPSVQPDLVQVEIIWPGASPKEVEQQVIQRVEEVLKNVPNVYRVTSEARESFGSLTVETSPTVNLNTFLNDVKNAVDSVTAFPRDIENPRVRRLEWRQEMIRVALAGDIGEKALTRLGNRLRDEMASLPYISQVEVFGARREEVTIELSERDLRNYGLSFSDVAAAIRRDSMNVSVGEVRTRTGDVQLRAQNLADTQTDFEQIVIRQTPGGGRVRVMDVATVIDGFEQNEILATLNGQPAVLLQSKASDNMQVVRASQAVKRWIERTQPTLPVGVVLELWSDNADVFEDRMELIAESSILGLILVFFVLILTLEPKVALWVTVGIGVSFLGAFALLPANDVSLNLLSTFAFLLVLGIVVDDAIVVGESIHHHVHQRGLSGEQAAVEGAFAVSRPVIFAVLTTIVAFAPWLFVSGVTAQFTRQLSVVITLALLFSLIEAFLILPSHLRNMKQTVSTSQWKLRQERVANAIVRFAQQTYRPFLERCLQRRYTTTMVFFSLFLVSLGLFNSGWVKFYFSPQVESEEVYINVRLPPGTPYSRSIEVLRQLQQAEKQLAAEVNAEAEAGQGTGQLIESWYTRARRGDVIAIVQLAPPDTRHLSARATAERFSDLVGDIPDADEVKVNYSFGDGEASITFLLQHDDLDALNAASRTLQQHLAGYDKTYFIRDDQWGALPELRFSLLPGAEKLGVTLGDVSSQVRQAFYGEEVQRLPREDGDVRVMVRYPEAERESLAAFEEVRIRTPDGRLIPLLAVAEVEVGLATRRITRRNGERVVTVNATVEPESLGEINRAVKEGFVPELVAMYPGLRVLKGGSQEAEAEFFSEITALYTVALFVIYALIAVAFRSYSLPLLIMTAMPFGFMGAVFGHLLFNEPMALFSYFGIGAAAGVVVNDNLVLIDYVRRLEREGLSSPEAIVASAVSRFRPIFLTTVTTFVGLIPIMAEQSTSAQFLKPAVLSLAFGVFFALFVSLLLVPAMYLV
ncbi:MAG: efflux RND transporter permease subunit, partial [Luminiphilus sp.]|nr:efflux RND transporter permease subunit [Luminiphilus sp.]